MTSSQRGSSSHRIMVAMLIVVPSAVAIMWTISRFEILTKGPKPVEVTVRNELFGDTGKETQFAPGPIAGYYLGLDAVLGTTVAALVIGLIGRSLARRQRTREKETHREAP